MTTFPGEPPSTAAPEPGEPAPPVIAPPPPSSWPPPQPQVAPAPAERLSPWVSIFTQPRATMRQVLDEDPRRMVHVLAMLGGLAEVIGSHIPQFPPFFTPDLGTVLILKVFLGVVGGLVMLYVGSAAIWMTGKWLGGRGTFVEVRSATAWSSVPAVWAALIWVPLVAYLGIEALNLDPESLLGDPSGLFLLVPIGAAGIVLAFWRLVIYLKVVGEAHRFSAWHSLGALLIAVVLLSIPVAILTVMAVALGGLAALGAAS